VKFFNSVYEWVTKNVRLPSAFSWETLILLWLFSWYMAWLATGFVQNLLANLGWIFLIFGVYWATTSTRLFWLFRNEKEKKWGFALSPWITGAVVSAYLFRQFPGESSREALVAWPVISAIIAALPDFLDKDLRPKSPEPQKRQNLIILFGTQFLLSCWFQFGYLIQDWLVQYPSLLADDFNQSAFVVKLESPLSAPMPRGATILDAMEPKVRAQFDGKPWPEVERLLLEQQRTTLISTLAEGTKQQTSPVEEDSLWQVASDVSARSSGYNLELQAIWQGPRSETQEYLVTKSCQIIPVSPPIRAVTPQTNNVQPTPPPVPVSRVQCDPVRGWGIDEPIIANQQ
jgi:hypothetical protein